MPDRLLSALHGLTTLDMPVLLPQMVPSRINHLNTIVDSSKPNIQQTRCEFDSMLS